MANGEYPTIVLLVDDQPMVGEAIRRLVAKEADITLHYCANGGDAIRMAEALRPTVILQDLILADMDGLTVVEQFRANPGTQSTPIIVLSTKEDPEVKSKAFAVGANDYVVKLPDRAELIARIRYHSRAYLNQRQRDEAFQALRESQQQLMESNATLVALNKQLNQFVGMAAHDLRNPLGVVLGFAKVLMRDKNAHYSPQQLKLLTSVQSSTEFMLRLVNDLLDVSKIEAGEITLDRKPVDIGALIQNNMMLNQALASEKHITVNVEIDPDLPHISADAHRIEQVFTNLFTNAIKYSHPEKSVHVAVKGMDHDVVISVRDQGQGIPLAEQDRLFKPFGTTSVRATQGEKSTGLGLMIAKKVVDAHGGRIWFDSQPGTGTTFFVALPAQAPVMTDASELVMSGAT